MSQRAGDGEMRKLLSMKITGDFFVSEFSIVLVFSPPFDRSNVRQIVLVQKVVKQIFRVLVPIDSLQYHPKHAGSKSFLSQNSPNIFLRLCLPLS